MNEKNKYVLCCNERATYLRINLDEVNTLKIDTGILDYALKNDKYLYIHADCLSYIEDAVKNQGEDFTVSTINFEDLSFLEDTVKYSTFPKSKKI